jgi:hypothetical protein
MPAITGIPKGGDDIALMTFRREIRSTLIFQTTHTINNRQGRIRTQGNPHYPIHPVAANIEALFSDTLVGNKLV